MLRILFVDDQPKILRGLRRMLCDLDDEWDMEFAESGPVALDLMAAAPVDVVVSDMRMPGMDGSQLLAEVMKRFPGTMRFVLSGQSDRQTTLSAVGVAHQFLSKPCGPDVLQASIVRACRFREHVVHPWQKELVASGGAIPSFASVHAELVDALKSPKSGKQEIARLVSRDAGMAARLLQLVNSDFFGSSQPVSNPATAVDLLGLDTIGLLVSSGKAFRPLDVKGAEKDVFRELEEHGVMVAEAAGSIARAETEDEELIDHASLAGLLHDVGMLMLAQKSRDRYRETLALARAGKCQVWEAEEGIYNAAHANVAAGAIALWGLPESVVDAVAMHHWPSRSADRAFTALTAVHVANCCLESRIRDMIGTADTVDMEYLRRIGLSDRLDTWRDICGVGEPEGAMS